MQLEPTLLAAIDRRLWKDLGFREPEPCVLPFLPMLCVAWSDGKLGPQEAERIRAHMGDLDDGPRAWLESRLSQPPGPYFRYQVAHLIAFLRSVWPQSGEGPDCWTDEARDWAEEIIEERGWFRRILGGLRAEDRTRKELLGLIDQGGILPTERIWALTRGIRADGEPQRVVAVVEEGEEFTQVMGISLVAPESGESLAVAAVVRIVRDEDLAEADVARVLARSRHLPEAERWIGLAELIFARGRPLTERQRAEILARAADQGPRLVEIPFAELAYLEDHLARDARWTSWVPGSLDELHVDREGVRRDEAPGTFAASRAEVQVMLRPTPVPGPAGLAFAVLAIEATGRSLHLATPMLTQEPATAEAIAWIARFLPATIDPFTQLVLDEVSGEWVAEVHSHAPSRSSRIAEPLPEGRALVVPPWIWYRACWSLGLRPDLGRRREKSRETNGTHA